MTGHTWFSEIMVPKALGLVDASLERPASGKEGQLHHKLQALFWSFIFSFFQICGAQCCVARVKDRFFEMKVKGKEML